ncbi:hypothetical protein L0Y46_00740 [bacterium]|nr:hypothetical protein [bacterium]
MAPAGRARRDRPDRPRVRRVSPESLAAPRRIREYLQAGGIRDVDPTRSRREAHAAEYLATRAAADLEARSRSERRR